ncbi:type II toxin-antitoxin system VapC family toxin [Nocardioides rubriscoriae]|uniref:type II toxin-antitoxin system VapC family toxin n=1 Tax=Nocardioides rubriscoriae TaxID=642762 RepID=UPI0011DFA0F7|nr:type II toxin-antitoxin system VapC family toxin [Nocardioides rubriscoriae]
MTALFLDASVVLLALGGPHPAKPACQSLLRASGEGRCTLHLSVEAVQEVVFHRMRVGTRAAALASGRALSATAVLHGFDVDVLHRSMLLVDTCQIRGRDAVHAATALAHGFTEIVTTDLDFEAVPGLVVVDPATAVARL